MERPENITKMLQLEIEVKSEEAAKLYDTFTKDTKDNIIPKEAFILGFLHGQEKLMNDMGLFDDEDDDAKIYDFIKSNPDKFKQK
jgi:hypothetical protein